MAKEQYVEGQVLTPEFHKWEEEGQEIRGFLRSMQPISGSGGSTYNIYTVEKLEGGMVKFSLGSATDRDLADLLNLGQPYVFNFQGFKQLEGRRRMKCFKVIELNLA